MLEWLRKHMLKIIGVIVSLVLLQVRNVVQCDT